MHYIIDMGEYALVLDEMVDFLAQARAPIIDQERDDTLTLSQRMKMDNLYLANSDSAHAARSHNRAAQRLGAAQRERLGIRLPHASLVCGYLAEDSVSCARWATRDTASSSCWVRG